jgi:PAS domain S-box-containing protein
VRVPPRADWARLTGSARGTPLAFSGRSVRFRALHAESERMIIEIVVAGAVCCGVWSGVRCFRRRFDSARRLQAVTLSSIGDAVIATDTAGTVTFMNAEAERLTGWRAADAHGRSLTDVFHVVHEHTGLLLEDPVAFVLRTREQWPLSNHTVLIDRDGHRMRTEQKATPIRESDGAIQGVVLVFRDCTRLREVEAALLERSLLHEHLSQIALTAPGVICAFRLWPDHSCTYPYASPGIRDIYGMSPEELARDASSIFNLIHPDDVGWIVESMTESARRLEVWRGEFRINHPAKGLIWVEGRSIPQREADGSVLWRGFLNDITTRKRAEEELRASEDRFRQIAENIREVFWLTDTAKGEIIYVSPAYEAIWGRTTSSLRLRPRQWMEAIHPDDRDRIIHAAATKQRIGEYDEEYRIVRPDGSERWIHDRAFPVHDAAGHVVRIAGVAADVTERRQLEAELRQAQKMESVGLLAGGVAHDFNNVLTVLMGSTEVLAEEMPTSPDCAAVLDDLRAATTRAATLTRQLLAFSRKDIVSSRVIEFNGLVADTERMLRRLVGEDIELTTSLDPRVAHVRIDPGQWDQVLVNLAVNARDAMTGCGRLAIETQNVTFTAESADVPDVPPGRYVRLLVSDTGSGMSADVMSRIFEPFFTTKTAGHGTGLGLAVVYGIVRQSGGRIYVRSQVNIGTTFTILIPAVDAPVERAVGTEIRSLPSNEPRHETILVVEDDESLRLLAARVLTSRGYNVLEAESGPHALRLLEGRTSPIDLLVTDVVMPTMNGRELADRVRRIAPSTRVLFTSGYTRDAVVQRGVHADEVAFLQKPYGPSVLIGKVVETLEHDAQSVAISSS